MRQVGRLLGLADGVLQCGGGSLEKVQRPIPAAAAVDPYTFKKLTSKASPYIMIVN